MNKRLTTEDRIIAEQNGSVTINVEPIPFAGMITLTESALEHKELTEAGGMIGVLRENVSLQADYIAQLAKALESSLALNKAQAERQVKELTDDEIADLIKATNDETGFGHIRIFDFVKVLLKKLQEK
jgi:hypothetical protein